MSAVLSTSDTADTTVSTLSIGINPVHTWRGENRWHRMAHSLMTWQPASVSFGSRIECIPIPAEV
jgi:hypothetical protein